GEPASMPAGTRSSGNTSIRNGAGETSARRSGNPAAPETLPIPGLGATPNSIGVGAGAVWLTDSGDVAFPPLPGRSQDDAAHGQTLDRLQRLLRNGVWPAFGSRRPAPERPGEARHRLTRGDPAGPESLADEERRTGRLPGDREARLAEPVLAPAVGEPQDEQAGVVGCSNDPFRAR